MSEVAQQTPGNETNGSSTGQRAAMSSDSEIVLSVRGVDVAFGTNQVLKGLDLDVYAGEILGFVGASGIGKSVLMRTILGPQSVSGGNYRAVWQ